MSKEEFDKLCVSIGIVLLPILLLFAAWVTSQHQVDAWQRAAAAAIEEQP